MKIVKTNPSNGDTDKYTFYRRDAQGNIMATYEAWYNGTEWEYRQVEVDLYGSSRLGRVVTDRQLFPESGTSYPAPDVFFNPSYNTTYSEYTSTNILDIGITSLNSTDVFTNVIKTPVLKTGTDLFDNTDAVDYNKGLFITTHRKIGSTEYELSNHLGNVMVVVTDRKIPHDGGGSVDYFLPDVITATDYYPFGMQMPGRTYSITKTVGVPIIDHNFDGGNHISNWSSWGLTVSASGDDRLKAEGTGAWSDAHISIPLKVGKRYRLTASISLGPNLTSVKYMAKNPNDGTSPGNRIMNNEQGISNFEIALNQ